MLLFTSAAECRALRLAAFAGIGACNLNLICMALAGLIVAAGRRIAGNLRRLAGNIIRIAGSVIFTLTEAVAAGLICHFCISAAYMDIILATAVILIIRTVYNGTV